MAEAKKTMSLLERAAAAATTGDLDALSLIANEMSKNMSSSRFYPDALVSIGEMLLKADPEKYKSDAQNWADKVIGFGENTEAGTRAIHLWGETIEVAAQLDMNKTVGWLRTEIENGRMRPMQQKEAVKRFIETINACALDNPRLAVDEFRGVLQSSNDLSPEVRSQMVDAVPVLAQALLKSKNEDKGILRDFVLTLTDGALPYATPVQEKNLADLWRSQFDSILASKEWERAVRKGNYGCDQVVNRPTSSPYKKAVRAGLYELSVSLPKKMRLDALRTLVGTLALCEADSAEKDPALACAREKIDTIAHKEGTIEVVCALRNIHRYTSKPFVSQFIGEEAIRYVPLLLTEKRASDRFCIDVARLLRSVASRSDAGSETEKKLVDLWGKTIDRISESNIDDAICEVTILPRCSSEKSIFQESIDVKLLQLLSQKAKSDPAGALEETFWCLSCDPGVSEDLRKKYAFLADSCAEKMMEKEPEKLVPIMLEHLEDLDKSNPFTHQMVDITIRAVGVLAEREPRGARVHILALKGMPALFLPEQAKRLAAVEETTSERPETKESMRAFQAALKKIRGAQPL